MDQFGEGVSFTCSEVNSSFANFNFLLELGLRDKGQLSFLFVEWFVAEILFDVLLMLIFFFIIFLLAHKKYIADWSLVSNFI